jgi:hypothetical protein
MKYTKQIIWMEALPLFVIVYLRADQQRQTVVTEGALFKLLNVFVGEYPQS